MAAEQGDAVPAPPAVPPRYGLVAAMAAVDGPERWQTGVRYDPEGCGIGGAVQADCTPDTGEFTSLPSNPAELYFDAFEVYAGDRCSASGHAARDFEGRSQRAVAAVQSHQIAAELWNGTLTQARHADPGDRSPYLTDGDASSLGTITGAARAIARLDAEFARCSKGRRAVIHLTPWALGLALEGGEGVLYRDGQLILTQLGSIVVADSGYGSSVTDLRAFVTSLVGIRLDPIRTVPDAGDLMAALDRGTNTITWWAQRMALYQFDADCCRYSVTIGT